MPKQINSIADLLEALQGNTENSHYAHIPHTDAAEEAVGKSVLAAISQIVREYQPGQTGKPVCPGCGLIALMEGVKHFVEQSEDSTTEQASLYMSVAHSMTTLAKATDNNAAANYLREQQGKQVTASIQDRDTFPKGGKIWKEGDPLPADMPDMVKMAIRRYTSEGKVVTLHDGGIVQIDLPA